MCLFDIFSDSIISVHDLETLSPITQLSKTRGASLFTTDIQVHSGMT